MNFSLLPNDAREFKDYLEAFAYIVLRSCLENEVINIPGYFSDVNNGSNLAAAYGSTVFVGSGNIQILRRRADARGDAGDKTRINSDDIRLLQTEADRYALFDGASFFTMHENHHNETLADVFTTGRLASLALARLTRGVFVPQDKGYHVVKIDRDLIQKLCRRVVVKAHE